MRNLQPCFLLIFYLNLIKTFLCYEPPWMNHIQKTSLIIVPDDVQERAVTELAKRLLAEDASSFMFQVNHSLYENKKDLFQIISPMSPYDSRVLIRATTGVAASWGLLYYLKYYCNSHVSWEANQLTLPSPLPRAMEKIVARDRFRYYQNVCTVSYSFAWWQWPQWERHIDWMALNGINFPLAFTGQEAIWRRVYHKFNLTDEDLKEHFVGPAYLAWGRMGNIKEWQGPLSESWHKNTLALQHRILRRMREFGMIPILPAFAGHVPPAIKRIYPNAQVTRLSAWSKFTSDNYTRTYFLDPRDSLFRKIGVAFINELQREFNGTSHFYNCDTFNEMTPSSGSSFYLSSVGKAIFKAMTYADADAVWVMQGWIFQSEFWTYKRAKALLTSVPIGRMIILDLESETSPQYGRLDSYFGQPFIFCLLQNFGGVDGLSGNVNRLLQNMNAARLDPNTTMVGSGLTPEGINQNYVLFDFMLELAWRATPPDVSQWAQQYSVRRYGETSQELLQAWQLLISSVYNCEGDGGLQFHGANILIQHRPNFIRTNSPCYKFSTLLTVWDKFVAPIMDNAFRDESFNISQEFTESNSSIGNFSEWQLLMNDEYNTSSQIKDENATEDWEVEFWDKDLNDTLRNESNAVHIEQNNVFGARKRAKLVPLSSRDTFRHDLVDITREVLQNIAGNYIEKLRILFLVEDISSFSSLAQQLNILLKELDLLLGSSKNFLLGSWLQDAVSWASNEQEKEQYLSNALYQITLWGPNGEILDYAVKQWNGVVRDYMLPRWNLFTYVLYDCLISKKSFNQKKFDELVFRRVEKPFAEGKTAKRHNYYASNEQGDLISIVKYLYKKYRNQL